MEDPDAEGCKFATGVLPRPGPQRITPDLSGRVKEFALKNMNDEERMAALQRKPLVYSDPFRIAELRTQLQVYMETQYDTMVMMMGQEGADQQVADMEMAIVHLEAKQNQGFNMDTREIETYWKTHVPKVLQSQFADSIGVVGVATGAARGTPAPTDVPTPPWEHPTIGTEIDGEMRSRDATLPELDVHGRPTRILPEVTRAVPLPAGCNLASTRRSSRGDVVTIAYTGTIDASSLTGVPGKTFDATADHDGARPLKFVLGEGQVLAGLDLGLTGMCVGERRTLVLAPAIAYGKDGAQEGGMKTASADRTEAGDNISPASEFRSYGVVGHSAQQHMIFERRRADVPGGATLRFEVELVAIADPWDWSPLFGAADADHDGWLDDREVSRWFTGPLGHEFVPDGALFVDADKNRDGRVDGVEFRAGHGLARAMGARPDLARMRHNDHANWPVRGWSSLDDVPYVVEPAAYGPWRCKGHPERFTKETCGACVDVVTPVSISTGGGLLGFTLGDGRVVAAIDPQGHAAALEASGALALGDVLMGVTDHDGALVAVEGHALADVRRRLRDAPDPKRLTFARGFARNGPEGKDLRGMFAEADVSPRDDLVSEAELRVWFAETLGRRAGPPADLFAHADVDRDGFVGLHTSVRPHDTAQPDEVFTYFDAETEADYLRTLVNKTAFSGSRLGTGDGGVTTRAGCELTGGAWADGDWSNGYGRLDASQEASQAAWAAAAAKARANRAALLALVSTSGELPAKTVQDIADIDAELYRIASARCEQCRAACVTSALDGDEVRPVDSASCIAHCDTLPDCRCDACHDACPALPSQRDTGAWPAQHAASAATYAGPEDVTCAGTCNTASDTGCLEASDPRRIALAARRAELLAAAQAAAAKRTAEMAVSGDITTLAWDEDDDRASASGNTHTSNTGSRLAKPHYQHPWVVVLLGCTDPIARNYDPHATRDDGMCCGPGTGVTCPGQNPRDGCTDPRADNFKYWAAADDGSCCGTAIGEPCKVEEELDAVQAEKLLLAQIKESNEHASITDTAIPYDGMGGREDPRMYFYNVQTHELARELPEGMGPSDANAARQAAVDAAFLNEGNVFDAPQQFSEASLDDGVGPLGVGTGASASTFDVAGNVVGSEPTKLAAEHAAQGLTETTMHDSGGVHSAGVEAEAHPKYAGTTGTWEDIDWGERRRRRQLRAQLAELAKSDRTLREAMIHPPPLEAGGRERYPGAGGRK